MILVYCLQRGITDKPRPRQEPLGDTTTPPPNLTQSLILTLTLIRRFLSGWFIVREGYPDTPK